MNNTNIRALGYAKSTVSFEKSTDPLTKLAKEFETAEEFIQGLHNRVIEQTEMVYRESAKDSLFNPEGLVLKDHFGYVKGILAKTLLMKTYLYTGIFLKSSERHLMN